MYWTVELDMYDTTVLLLKKGAEVNGISNMGRPILHRAVLQDDWTECERYSKLLLEFGADPNIKDGDGNSVLHLAVQKKTPAKYVLPLIEAGLDVEIMNNNGEAALEMAERPAIESQE